MDYVRTAAEVRDQWVAGLTRPPTANGAQGAAGEHLVLHLLRTTSIPILRPDPERTWVWSDLHLGDPSVLDAWDRPFSTLSVDTHGFDEAHLALHAPSEPPLLPTHIPLHEVAVGAVNIHEHLHQRLWQPRGRGSTVLPGTWFGVR